MALVLRRALGLDVGSHTVKAVELRQTSSGVEVGQLRAMPRRDPAAASDADSDASFPERLRQWLALHALPVEHVVASLPADRLTTRRLSFPFRDRRRLSQAVPFEVEGELPLALEDVMVGFEVVGGDRSRSDVLAIVAPRREIGDAIGRLHEAGLEPRTLEAEGFVLGNLGAVVPQPGVRLVADLGHRKSVFALLAEGRVVAQRSIALGGRALGDALARDLGVGPAEAERRKHEEGLLVRREDGRFESTSAAAGAVLDRLALELVRTLGAFAPWIEALSGPVESLLLLGGTARLPHLDVWLADRIGLPVQRLAMPPGALGSGLVAGGDPALFGPAIALAARGTLSAKTRLDFRRDEFALRVDLREMLRGFGSTARIASATVVLGALLLATGTVVESRRASRLESALGEVYAGIFPGQPAPASPVTAMREAVRSAHERADALGVYRGNLSALDLLTEISARVPADLEVVFEELAIDREVVRVRGFSKSFEAVDRLRGELAKFEPFAQIQVSEVKEETKRGGKSFSLTISLARAAEDAA